MEVLPRAARFSCVKCWVFPRLDPSNPYQALLAESLRRHGIESDTGPRLIPSWAATVPREDAVHLHWVEFLIFSKRGGRLFGGLFMTVRAVRMIVALAILRLRGLPVVWTVHNLAPHESRHRRLERTTLRIVSRLATTLHVHSQWARERVVSELRVHDLSKFRVAPHGNYIKSYGQSQSRLASRRILGLPGSAHVYLIFGAVRTYKRIPETIHAFGRLADPEALLVIAGRVIDASLRERIEQMADEDPRVILRLTFVPEDAIASLFGAADAAILNYEEVFSSGALMAALSMGTPVVAPVGGTTAEIASPPAIETFEGAGLAQALRRVVQGDPQPRREAALEAARRCDWDTVASQLVTAFLVNP